MVRDVLDAALEEFAERGYEGLSIEEVAARAGVNKTTVYRRWPTKADLMRAALLDAADEDVDLPNTGDVRADLVQLFSARVTKLMTPRRLSIARAVLIGGANPELAAIARTLRDKRWAITEQLLERGVKRGELSRDTDLRLISEVLGGAIHARMFKREHIDDAYLMRVVSLVIDGAAHGGAGKATRRARASKK